MGAPVEDTGARQLRAVTASDTVPLTLGVCRALWVGEGGNVAVIVEGDTSAVTLVGVVAGQIVPVKAKYVMSANTTAASLVAMY